ncbi:MAG TPA: hypothetical protein VG844_16730 [Terracidiphilus sp.]|nr:hypothetical protein [Terracidiphilus sp.]
MSLIVYHRRIHREGYDVELTIEAAGLHRPLPAQSAPFTRASQWEDLQA